MNHVDEHTAVFREVVERMLQDVFGVGTNGSTEVLEDTSIHTQKPLMVSIHFTGTVFGEYIIAMDPETATRIACGDEDAESGVSIDIFGEVCDALCEVLNMTVGEAVVDLQQYYTKLTIAAPRVVMGQIRYPEFRTGTTTLHTTAGDVECHFCLDLMRLNLAESYGDAMDSLLEVNYKLEEANHAIAEQQTQLDQASRMASIGMLAAGMTQEINDPLVKVEANLSTMDECVSEVSKPMERQAVTNDEKLDVVLRNVRKLLSETRDRTRRIQDIVDRFDDASHLDSDGTVSASVNVMVDNVVSLMAGDLASYDLHTEFDDVPEIHCKPGDIGQVLINLLLNSMQASEPGGKIRISTRASDQEVVVEVQDNGCGIEEYDLGRVFDPFFTTKEGGESSGMGLSISYGIIARHEGQLSIESKRNEGTTATIRLPRVTSPVAC